MLIAPVDSITSLLAYNIYGTVPVTTFTPVASLTTLNKILFAMVDWETFKDVDCRACRKNDVSENDLVSSAGSIMDGLYCDPINRLLREIRDRRNADGRERLPRVRRDRLRVVRELNL